MIKTGSEQATSESFRHLDICCGLVESKYDRGPIRSWTNGDYVKLSAHILRETGILVSANTLKRIFGKIRTSSRYYPQKATRDALARYANFASWEDLETRYELPASGQGRQEEAAGDRKFREGREPLSLEPGEHPGQDPHTLLIGREQDTGTISKGRRPDGHDFKSPKRRIQIAAALAAAALLLTLWVWMSAPDLSVNLDNVALICKNPVGGNPHSAVFELVLPPGFSDRTVSFAVDFGDGKHESLNMDNRLVTHYYEIPGRYYALFKYNDITLDTIPVYLMTENWTATATMMHDTTRVYPVINTPLFRDGEMTVSSLDLYHAGIDTNQTFFVHFALSKPMNISGDNFLLSANVKTSPLRPGVRCSQVVVTILGEKSHHNFFIIKPGCVTWSRLRFSEVAKLGKYNDLSFLGADLTSGGSFKLEVVDRSVSLWINDALALQTRYQVPLQEIKGIQFTFAGTGFVDQVLLKDLETGVAYATDFSE